MTELEALTRLASRRDRAGRDGMLRRLRGVYESFTEGFATQQLNAARSLLDGS